MEMIVLAFQNSSNILVNNLKLKLFGNLASFQVWRLFQIPLDIISLKPNMPQGLFVKQDSPKTKSLQLPWRQMPNLISKMELLFQILHYWQLVGSLIYLIVSRTGITKAIRIFSQYMILPHTANFVAVLLILRYIKGTLFHGLHFSSHSTLKLIGYFDVNQTGDPHYCCSTSSCCFILGYSLISWHSIKQITVPRSSIETEC